MKRFRTSMRARSRSFLSGVRLRAEHEAPARPTPTRARRSPKRPAARRAESSWPGRVALSSISSCRLDFRLFLLHLGQAGEHLGPAQDRVRVLDERQVGQLPKTLHQLVGPLGPELGGVVPHSQDGTTDRLPVDDRVVELEDRLREGGVVPSPGHAIDEVLGRRFEVGGNRRLAAVGLLDEVELDRLVRLLDHTAVAELLSAPTSRDDADGRRRDENKSGRPRASRVFMRGTPGHARRNTSNEICRTAHFTGAGDPHQVQGVSGGGENERRDANRRPRPKRFHFFISPSAFSA